MKKAVIGGMISLIGSIWALAMILLAANNLTAMWSTPPGRLLTTLSNMEIMPFFVISLLFVALGIVLMAIELFKKEP